MLRLEGNWSINIFRPSDIFLSWSENKKWFFSQNNHFLFTKQSILMVGKLAAVITQIYFGKFCYCVPGWKILKHGFFVPLGGPLWPCDSLLLWTGLFIQIHSETLCMFEFTKSWKGFSKSFDTKEGWNNFQCDGRKTSCMILQHSVNNFWH